MNTLTKAAQDVLAERQRQHDKGYDATHDAQHSADELAYQAAFYLLPTKPSPHLWAHKCKTVDRDDRRTQILKGVALGLAALELMDHTDGGVHLPDPTRRTAVNEDHKTFEAWARGPAGYVDDQLAKYADGSYQDSTTRLHWSIWQAACKATRGASVPGQVTLQHLQLGAEGDGLLASPQVDDKLPDERSQLGVGEVGVSVAQNNVQDGKAEFNVHPDMVQASGGASGVARLDGSQQ